MSNVRLLQVNGSGWRYDLSIGRGLIAGCLESVAKELRPDKVIVVSDENVAPIYLGKIARPAGIPVHSVVLPAKEGTKSFSQFQSLSEEILGAGITRNSVLVALGGGVIGDLVGFTASTLLRGIRFVQVPTSLLAQVDSSVGGKSGINSVHGKNLIGAFHQPTKVMIDVDVLGTLPTQEFRHGYAEVVKYALIRDAGFFQWLEGHLEKIQGQSSDVLIEMIHRCCEMKAKIVEVDERESGERMLLNFGHTFGHAIEMLSGFEIHHGAAVAIGMALASRLSSRLGFLDEEEGRKIISHLLRAGLPTDSPYALERLVPIMKKDKKAAAVGDLSLILLERIGQAFVKRDVKECEVVSL